MESLPAVSSAEFALTCSHLQCDLGSLRATARFPATPLTNWRAPKTSKLHNAKTRNLALPRDLSRFYWSVWVGGVL
jgi:hypothetical protein